jgi:hypothetical protein
VPSWLVDKPGRSSVSPMALGVQVQSAGRAAEGIGTRLRDSVLGELPIGVVALRSATENESRAGLLVARGIRTTGSRAAFRTYLSRLLRRTDLQRRAHHHRLACSLPLPVSPINEL